MFKTFVILCLIFKFRNFFANLPSFIYWVVKDTIKYRKEGRGFTQYGLRMFCGRQGGGKTVGMVWLLEQWRRKYPNLKIYTNIDYEHQDGKLTGWNDLLNPDLRNGTDGVVFAIDEIQNEFSSNAWKDFPESILSEITQQRKQRICILATSQVFTRVAKPLREQCYQVIECRTFLERWTRLKAYDADDYNSIIDCHDPAKKFKLHKIWKTSFVQTDELRNLFDTYAKVERMAKVGFAPKIQTLN